MQVTDEWDRRTLLTILGDIYCPEIMNSDFKLCESGQFTVNDGSYSTQIEFIRKLPATSADVHLCDCIVVTTIEAHFVFLRFQVFGLTSNAEITTAINETEQLFNSVLLTQASTVYVSLSLLSSPS